FVGLIVPHIARQLFGSDLRQSLPASAVLGALLLLGADIAARVVILPQEVPVGVMTALMGAPFFILLAQRRGNHAE
ncbi:MAG: iron chelate uptake ABC transporter family permease subunit, partial [Enterobacteriaceae bacterium]|nr:iron chelate uptake ABC transporter family permease subunit [Enterobacteriaceae bacterium]